MIRRKIGAVGVATEHYLGRNANSGVAGVGRTQQGLRPRQIKGGHHCRLARESEKFLALDGKTYSLKPDNCVVADQDRAVGIGGVMGGEETGVTDSTENILLEAAYFLPASIRRTARDLNLPSDASYRFERGVDTHTMLAA